MLNKEAQITQYFSKWRKCWVYFQDNHVNKYKPNKAEVSELLSNT